MKRETAVVSTSYGGITRVRFGGSFPRGGKSRLLDREAPLSCLRTVDANSESAKPEVANLGQPHSSIAGSLALVGDAAGMRGRGNFQFAHNKELGATVVADNDTAAALASELGRITSFIDIAVDLVRHVSALYLQFF